MKDIDRINSDIQESINDLNQILSDINKDSHYHDIDVIDFVLYMVVFIVMTLCTLLFFI